MSNFSLYLPGKRLPKNRQRLPKVTLLSLSRSTGGAYYTSSDRNKLSIRRSFVLSKNISSGPLSLLQGAQSPAFSFLGTICLAMTAVLFLLLQPATTATQAQAATTNTMYQEFKETSLFPKTKAIEQQLMSSNKLASYIIQSGDTLQTICTHLSTDCEVVKTLNNLEYPYNLRIGSTLYYKK